MTDAQMKEIARGLIWDEIDKASESAKLWSITTN